MTSSSAIGSPMRTPLQGREERLESVHSNCRRRPTDGTPAVADQNSNQSFWLPLQMSSMPSRWHGRAIRGTLSLRRRWRTSSPAVPYQMLRAWQHIKAYSPNHNPEFDPAVGAIRLLAQSSHGRREAILEVTSGYHQAAGGLERGGGGTIVDRSRPAWGGGPQGRDRERERRNRSRFGRQFSDSGHREGYRRFCDGAARTVLCCARPAR